LNIEFTAQFLTDVLIGGLRLQRPESLIKLSKWADFSQPPGFRRILTQEELHEFGSVIGFSKRLVDDPTAPFEIPQPSPAASTETQTAETSETVNSAQ
jgi:hypothetical protein